MKFLLLILMFVSSTVMASGHKDSRQSNRPRSEAFMRMFKAQNADRFSRQQYCQSSGDCPGSDFCRDRGDGVKLCMGNGRTGDLCSSSGDCSGSLFCRDSGKFKVCMGEGRSGDACTSSGDCSGSLFCRDYDGRKYCMGDGRNGDPCSSSGDCNGSLFCRDRGDGLNVCM